MCGRGDYIHDLRGLSGGQPVGFDNDAYVVLADKGDAILETFRDYLVLNGSLLFASDRITVDAVSGGKTGLIVGVFVVDDAFQNADRFVAGLLSGIPRIVKIIIVRGGLYAFSVSDRFGNNGSFRR